MDSQDNYYDHYKDSFDLLKGSLKKRDIYTVVILILAAILFLQIQSPNDAEHVATSIIQNYINDLSINFKYVNSILIFTYLWIVMQYYQIVLLIERNYTYIHKLEKTLSEDGVFLIQREGVNYLQSYPWMKSFVNIIYKLLFPIMIAVVAIFKFIIELKNKYDFISVYDLANQIVAAATQTKITGVINVCSGKPVSLADRVEEFIKENNFNIKLQYGAFPDRAYDSPAVLGDNSKILEILEGLQ